jgi:hypothetical protein
MMPASSSGMCLAVRDGPASAPPREGEWKKTCALHVLCGRTRALETFGICAGSFGFQPVVPLSTTLIARRLPSELQPRRSALTSNDQLTNDLSELAASTELAGWERTHGRRSIPSAQRWSPLLCLDVKLHAHWAEEAEAREAGLRAERPPQCHARFVVSRRQRSRENEPPSASLDGDPVPQR